MYFMLSLDLVIWTVWWRQTIGDKDRSSVVFDIVSVCCLHLYWLENLGHCTRVVWHDRVTVVEYALATLPWEFRYISSAPTQFNHPFYPFFIYLFKKHQFDEWKEGEKNQRTETKKGGGERIRSDRNRKKRIRSPIRFGVWGTNEDQEASHCWHWN